MAEPIRRVLHVVDTADGQVAVLRCEHRLPFPPDANRFLLPCPHCPPVPDPVEETDPPEPVSAPQTVEAAQEVQEGLFEVPRPDLAAPRVLIARRAPATSQAAADRARLNAGTLRKEVYDLLTAAGESGMTDEEIEVALAGKHQSISACRRSLVLDGWVTDSGQRRVLRNGNEATVWLALP